MTPSERSRLVRPFRVGLAVAAGTGLAVDERAIRMAIVAALVITSLTAMMILISRRAGPGWADADRDW